jgi:hypothetical protein
VGAENSQIIRGATYPERDQEKDQEK